MNKKEKLKKLLAQLNALQEQPILPSEDLTNLTDQLIEEEISSLTSRLKENPTIRTLQRFTSELTRFKQDFNLKPVIDSITALQQEMKLSEDNLLTKFETRISSIKSAPDLTSNLVALNEEFNTKIQELESNTFQEELENIKEQLQVIVQNDIEKDKSSEEELAKKFLILNDRINNIGGGSMNRQIFINGTDRLTKYTDINIKPGANVTITSVNNDTTKKVDITIASTGGGGGGGISRQINSVSISTAAGSASATDYVYLCSGTITLTLPDATTIGSNLYTIKNVGNGVVTVATTSSQTIDGALTQVMPVKFTSIDVDSDGTNWNIT